MKKLKGNLCFVYVVGAILWFCLKGMIAGLFTDREKYYRRRLGPDSDVIMRRIGATIDVKGLENLDPSKTYIMMGNHRSYTDILIVFIAMAAAKVDVTFMSKKEVFSIPLLGSTMKAMGMIGVERGDSSKAMRSFIAAEKAVKAGRTLVIFPEGTRSVDGKLQPLKKGAFLIAVRSGVPIAPFVIHGSDVFMPKSGVAIYPTHVSFTALPVIETKGKKEAELMELVETSIKSVL